MCPDRYACVFFKERERDRLRGFSKEMGVVATGGGQDSADERGESEGGLEDSNEGRRKQQDIPPVPLTYTIL